MRLQGLKALIGPKAKPAEVEGEIPEPADTAATAATPQPAPSPPAPAAPIVDPRYYDEGVRWEDDTYRTLRRSRFIAWSVAAASGALSTIALICLALLIPLKTFEPYVVTVDRTTGFLEVARALAPGELQQDEAITVANIVRYIRARETYDPRLIKDNYDLAQLLSAEQAARDLAELYAPSNLQSPDRVFGRETTVAVTVKSVSFLNQRTATVRFETAERTAQSVTTRHWVGVVRFRYSGAPMRNEWRFDNPLGFQVIEYRRDQETVPAGRPTG